jgi:hypothetical protein
MELVTSETASVVAQYQYAYFSSAQVHPDTGTNAGAATTLINNVRAAAAAASIPFATKFGVYQMATEFPIAGLGYITQAVKSGTSLTLTFRNIIDNADVTWMASATDMQVRGFTGVDAALNGTYTAANISPSGNVLTITGLSGSRAAVADGTRTGLACLAAKSSTVEYNFLTQIYQFGNMDDWFCRKYGAVSQTNRMTAENQAFPPWMNLSTYVGANSQGKRWGQVCAEYFSTNMINNIGSASDGIEFIFGDNTFDFRADVANSGHTFGGGAGSSNTDKYNYLNNSTWQDVVPDDGSASQTALTAHRQGVADYIQSCRNAAATRSKSKATPFFMGNHDCKNGVLTGYSNVMEAVFFENAFSQNVGSMSNANRSTNIPSAFGFGCYFNPTTQDATHGWIQQAAPKLLPNPGKVFLGCEFTNYNQYEAIRFAMCTAWLHPQGVPIVKADAGTRQAYAEMVGFGDSVSGAPTARAGWGGWEHTYQNALVLVNDTSGSLTKDLTGTGWKRIDAAALGVADDGVNSGGVAINGNFTVPAYSSRVLVLNFPGT